MNKTLKLLSGISIIIIFLYLIFGDFEKFVETKLQSEDSLILYSILSFLFLLSDIFLPVPSSLVMILNGKVLGILWGSVLSLISGVSSSVFGYYLGKKGKKIISRFYTESDLYSAEKFFKKFGPASIVISKIIPVISESVSILTGILNFSFTKYIILSAIGFLIVSVLFALIGGL